MLLATTTESSQRAVIKCAALAFTSGQRLACSYRPPMADTVAKVDLESIHNPGRPKPARAAARRPVAPSPYPSARLRLAISSQESPLRLGWPRPSSHDRAPPCPTRPALCRRPAAGVPVPFAWRPLPSRAHARGASAPVHRRELLCALLPSRLDERESFFRLATYRRLAFGFRWSSATGQIGG